MEPFTARRLDGKIVLEIDERMFVAGAVCDPAANLTVVDHDQFVEFALPHIFTLTHDIDANGATQSWWRRLSETLAKAAASSGQGIRRSDAVPPTCGCDPEEHDGG